MGILKFQPPQYYKGFSRRAPRAPKETFFLKILHMKFLYSLGAASAALGAACFPATAQADFGLMNSEEFSGIYDDFSDPSSGAPNPALWTALGDVTQAEGILTIDRDGSTKSTTDFGYGNFIFDFSNSSNIAHLGFGLVAGSNEILLRNESGALRLHVFANGITLVDGLTDLTPSYAFGPNDTWEFRYLGNHLTVLQNNNPVFDESLDLAAVGRVNLSMFGYSGGTMSLNSVSVSPIPEPSTYAAIAGVLALVACIARRSLRRANRD